MFSGQESTLPSDTLLQFILRLHFYVGIFVGPFIFVAALTGTLYALTPQLEEVVYRDVLNTENFDKPKPLSDQIKAAKSFLDTDLELYSVRPSIAPGKTSRVLFRDSSVNFSGIKAVFVDPSTLDVNGVLPVYGTSGVLPLRMNLDQLHRDLMLGEFGRYYGELAASWLWITALTGVFLWFKGGKRNSEKMSARVALLGMRRRHGQLGLIILAGLLFVSITGLTWSKWAGGNIGHWRAELGWVTPSVDLSLNPVGGNKSEDEHVLHGLSVGDSNDEMPDIVDLFDRISVLARAEGIDSNQLEIIPARTMDTAWTVREIDQSWPTQIDTVAINPHTMKITSRADFADFPLIAKLIRWGIDAHIGALFGVLNQVLVAVFGISICFMVIWGYGMWWIKRKQTYSTSTTLIQSWCHLRLTKKLTVLGLAILVAWALPVLGVSLLFFAAYDGIRTFFLRTRFS